MFYTFELLYVFLGSRHPLVLRLHYNYGTTCLQYSFIHVIMAVDETVAPIYLSIISISYFILFVYILFPYLNFHTMYLFDLDSLLLTSLLCDFLLYILRRHWRREPVKSFHCQRLLDCDCCVWQLKYLTKVNYLINLKHQVNYFLSKNIIVEG